MNLFNYISGSELQMIEYSICEYSDMHSRDQELNLKDILRHWESAKSQFLFKLFGEKLILTKNVNFQKDQMSMEIEMENLCNPYTSEAKLFVSNYDMFCRDMRQSHGSEFYWNLRDLLGSRCLVDNIYNGESFMVDAPNGNGKSIVVAKGCKVSKVLGKIAKLYNIPGYEDFRIAHSLILNQKQLSGTLNLSIHPLDYITMSDNSCCWDSCMSWASWGSYRRGTVEMMNSPCAIVAYLTAKEPYSIGDNSWYNKKWRELFIINEDIISDVKGYPYNNETLELQVMDWLKELAADNMGMHYDDKLRKIEAYTPQRLIEDEPDYKYTIRYSTDAMYNDCCDQQIYLGKHNADPENYQRGMTKEILVDYSGVSSCIVCGNIEVEFSCEEDLACSDCSRSIHCACCGDRIDFDAAVEFQGDYYCSYCYDEHVIRCDICNDECWDDDIIRIHFALDDKHILRECRAHACYNCEDKDLHDVNPACFKPGTKIVSIETNANFWWSSTYRCIMVDNLTDQGLYSYIGFKTIESFKEAIKQNEFGVFPFVDFS